MLQSSVLKVCYDAGELEVYSGSYSISVRIGKKLPKSLCGRVFCCMEYFYGQWISTSSTKFAMTPPQLQFVQVIKINKNHIVALSTKNPTELPQASCKFNAVHIKRSGD